MAVDRRIREFQTTPEALGRDFFLVDYRLRPGAGESLELATWKTLMISTRGAVRPLSYEPGFSRGVAKWPLEVAGGYILIQEDPISGSGHVTLGYPLASVSETEGLVGLMQLLGGAAEYAYTEEFWVERVTLPGTFLARYVGPRFGSHGIRARLGVESARPPLGLIIKPRSGVALEKIANVARDALRGGCDFVCDDHLLVDPTGDMAFARRAPVLARVAQEEAGRAGEPKHYLANVSAPPRRADGLAERALECGASALIVNAFTMGLGAVEEFVDQWSQHAPIITTNMGVALMSRAPTGNNAKLTQTGMSEAIFAKLCRVAGVDAVHTGTVEAECYGEMEWNRTNRAVREPLGELKPCMGVAAGDLGVSHLWANIASLGRDTLVEVETGIANYPDGPEAGAQIFRKLLEELDPDSMDDREATAVLDTIARRNSTLAKVLDAEAS